MEFKRILGLFILSAIFQVAFAAETVVKEDTTPPAPEGALPADQIPPFIKSDKSDKSVSTPTTQTKASNPQEATPPPMPSGVPETIIKVQPSGTTVEQPAMLPIPNNNKMNPNTAP